MPKLLLFFFLIEVGLLAIPPAASRFSRKNFLSKKHLYTISGFAISIGALIIWSPFSMTGYVADGIILIAAYFFFCLVVSTLMQLPDRIEKACGIILNIPILLGRIAGIGFLGIGFIAAEFDSAKTVSVSNKYTCQFTLIGGAYTSGGGTEVAVLYHPLMLPFFEFRIYKNLFSYGKYEYLNAHCFLDIESGVEKLVLEVPVSEGVPFRHEVVMN